MDMGFWTRKEDKQNVLDVKVRNYGDCGFCKDEDNEETLTVPWETYSRWLYLCNQFPDKEWSGIYTVVSGLISNFRIPKQEISTASVKLAEDLGGNGIVHSHHGMGAFHSGQDDKACRNLYDYSVVLAHDGYTVSKRRELPCGGFGYVEIVLLVSDIPEDLGMEKITEEAAAAVITAKPPGRNTDTDDKHNTAQSGLPRNLWDTYNDLRTESLVDDNPENWEGMAETCAGCPSEETGEGCENCDDLQDHIALREERDGMENNCP